MLRANPEDGAEFFRYNWRHFRGTPTGQPRDSCYYLYMYHKQDITLSALHVLIHLILKIIALPERHILHDCTDKDSKAQNGSVSCQGSQSRV